jgi:hypothetical protein
MPVNPVFFSIIPYNKEEHGHQRKWGLSTNRPSYNQPVFVERCITDVRRICIRTREDSMTTEQPVYRMLTDEELSSMLQAASGSKELATTFWRPLTDFPVRLTKEGNYSQAQGLLFHLLRKCQAVAPAHFLKIHKLYFPLTEKAD